MFPVKQELTSSCVAPNHPRGLYYNSLAAHLTPHRRRGGLVGRLGPLLLFLSTWLSSTHTYTHCAEVYSKASASVGYIRQEIEHLTLCLSAREKLIPWLLCFTVGLLYSMVMLMSLFQEMSLGLTPGVQD